MISLFASHRRMPMPAGHSPSARRRALRLVLAICLGASAHAAFAETYRWTQYVPGAIEARAITDAATRPTATVNGSPEEMKPRVSAGDGFPLICALTLKAETRTIEIDGLRVAIPVAEPTRIAIIGDTGCRLEKEKTPEGKISARRVRAIVAEAPAPQVSFTNHFRSKEEFARGVL